MNISKEFTEKARGRQPFVYNSFLFFLFIFSNIEWKFKYKINDID